MGRFDDGQQQFSKNEDKAVKSKRVQGMMVSSNRVRGKRVQGVVVMRGS